MTTAAVQRDYSLTGKDTQAAQASGLAEAQWYQSPIPRARLKQLMQRRNGPALRDAFIWFALLGISGYLGYRFWHTWWAVPCFFVYGTLYGSSGDPRWHEGGHRTAFKTTWLNDVMYGIGSFMVLREPTIWRWSHTRHHTDTIIVGRDPEIQAPRPPDLLGIFLSCFSLKTGWRLLVKLLNHAGGRLLPDEATFVPESERWRVYWVARLYLLIYAGFITWAIAIRSFLPVMYVGLPSFYGAWLMIVFGLTQHAGLSEDVLDHRLCCRTVYFNPILRFLYLNMNYHVEHHMYPQVPYHALPKLHAELKGDMPPAYRGLWGAYREIIPTLWRQVKDPSYCARRPLPTRATSTAAPAEVPGVPGVPGVNPGLEMVVKPHE